MKNSDSDRLACVDLPAFPLQLLLKRHPEWSAHPAAVVAEDKPQGLILQVNEKARRFGVLPGLRYAAGFSLARDLRAGEVPPAEIQKAIKLMTQRLMRFTPEVEPSAPEPGVFWLNGKGLQRLYASPQKWGGAIFKDIRTQGLQASLVVGFTRFGTYAVAKAKQGITTFNDPANERSAAQKVPLDRLDIEPKFRDILFKLGIKTVGGLLSLPSGGLRERFGAQAHRLYRMAAGDLWSPLAPCAPEEPVAQKYLLDDAESDSTRLLFLIKQLLHPMLAQLAARTQALTTLWLCFLIDRGGWLKEQLRPAVPTLEEAQILDLVRLRLESLQLPAGVIEIELKAESCAATVEQLRLFAEQPKRDFDAANRALARLRAEFGSEAVVQAKLKDGHLPEARFAWEPLERIKPAAEPKGNAAATLIRRISEKPIMLAGGPYRTHEDGWLLLGPKHGSIDRLIGPYVYSGGWWNREIQRDYYFAETRRGDLLWLYYDRRRRRWFLHGCVE
jgi:protein ImuB